jgi:hypothetical protein
VDSQIELDALLLAILDRAISAELLEGVEREFHFV